MKFAILSPIAYAVFFCQRAKGNGAMLLKRYDIVGPDYEYDNWQYTMDFEVSDFMTDSMLGYSLYDGVKCRDGNGTIGDGDNDITQNDGYLISRFRTDNTPEGDGSGSRMIKIESEIIPSQMVGSSIYRQGANETDIVEYCLRFSNYNKDKDEPDAREVNFLETTVKVSINLNGDFGVKPFLDPNDVEELEETEGVAVEAYLCDRDENVVPITGLNQGQTIRVCVTPTPEVLERGFRMRQLEEFAYRREIPFSVKQQAIAGAEPDPLTVLQCRPGSVVCAFETVLFADFFVTEGVISGSGLAFLQISGDYSTEGRRLEESSKAADNPLRFTIDIQLVPAEDFVAFDQTESSAPAKVSVYTTTALLMSLLGTLFLLY